MLGRYKSITAVLGLAVAMAASSPSRTQEGTPTPSPLPGGATSLNEVHGDWTVSCRVGQQNDQDVPLCALSQQANQQGQRVLTIELRPSEDGAAGAMVLPFGLAVTQGVTLSIDEGRAGDPLPFSTCLPAGCIVPVSFDSAATEALRQGTSLAIMATVVNGGKTNLAISLTGFTSALTRARELME